MEQQIIDWSQMTEQDMENFVKEHPEVKLEKLKELVESEKRIKDAPIWLCGTLL